MKDIQDIRNQIRTMLKERLRLELSLDELGDDRPLFGEAPGSLGLDSVEALEIVVGLEDLFNITIEDGDDDQMQQHFYSIGTLADYVHELMKENDHQSGLS